MRRPRVYCTVHPPSQWSNGPKVAPTSKEVNTPFEVLRHSDQTATVTIPDIFAEAPAVPVTCWVHGFQFLIVSVCFCWFLRSLLKDSLGGQKTTSWSTLKGTISPVLIWWSVVKMTTGYLVWCTESASRTQKVPGSSWNVSFNALCFCLEESIGITGWGNQM
jgi:hypothetical protein